MFTAPWVFDSDSTETVCLTLRQVDTDGRITVKLSNANRQIVQQTKNIRKGRSECFELKVPETTEHQATIDIQGHFDDGYSFKDKRSIKIRHTPDIVLIQTDKHIYKAGEKVQFRVLHVTTAGFRPSPRKIKTIWIEDPLKVRLYENRAPVADKGIISSSLQLSDKPQLGNWTISVEDPAKKVTSKTFQVDKYVLPRFAVRIFIPSEIRPDCHSFTWKACANYTYGEAVKGQVNAKITRTSTQLPIKGRSQPPIYVKQEQIRGCLSMTVNRNDLSFDRNQFIQYDMLNFNVEVTEHGTGTMLDNSQQKEVKVNPFHLHILSKRYFKPGLHYYLKVLVKDSNDEPVKRDSFEVQVRTSNRKGVEEIRFRLNMKTNDEGIAQLDVPSFADPVQSLIFEITPSTSGQVYEYFGFRHSSAKPITIGKSITERLRSWSSPTHSYIKIESPTQSLHCNRPSRFTVHSTGLSDDTVKSKHLTVYFQIMARNDIIGQGQVSLERNKQMKDESTAFKFDIPITIESSMSPKAQILVYYIREDGEVVSDSEAFIVNECFTNPVGMKFNQESSLPDAEVDLELTASPNSLCSVFMTDKSAQLLSGREFNPHKILRIINDRPPNAPGLSADKQCIQIDPHLGVYERNKKMLGSQAAFDTIGMMTMSDLFLELNPCQPASKFGGQHGRKSFSSEDEWFGIEGQEIFGEEFDEVSETAIDKRVDFPETWLWRLIPIGNDGRKSIRPRIPHTITRWTGNSFCMSEDKGLGVSPEATILSFQPVFTTLTMPYCEKLGETVPVTVSVYSYLTTCYPVTVSLKQHREFKLISSSNEAEMCVCAKESSAHKFHIQPLKLGVVNISVSVSAVPALRSAVCASQLNVGRVKAFDFVTKPIVIKPQGIPKEKTDNKWICGHGESKTYKLPLKMPADGIKGTAKAFVSVAGDLIAPTIKGMNHLVVLPTGCGEQNMIKFTPLVFLLNYLKSTKQLTNALEVKAIAHLKSGYQNELKYRRKDGSFSAWGQREKDGSMWLTAFVVKSFALAKTFIFIDQNVIKVGKNWIIKHQNNGCFHHRGSLHHKEMQGGIGKGDNSPQTITLFATIALLEAGYNPLDQVIKNALACANRDANPSNLRLAMKAYATALAKKTNAAQDLLKTLEKRSIKAGDKQHWTNGPGSSREVNIEATAYVLLAIATLRAGHAEMGMDITRWLISQRRANGGFYSTQDTVIAVQAMETFASQLKEWNTDMKIAFTDKNMGKVVLNVNRGNRLTEQKRTIKMADTVQITTTGQGCTLLQITVKYEIAGKHSSVAFYLDVSVLPFTQPTAQHKETIHICTRFQGAKGKSNMALIEMQMVTGYEADNAQFQTLRNSHLNLKKFENARGKLVLYFNQLTGKLTCLDIVVTEKLVTKHRKPAIIKVYDYYEPEKQTSKEYALLYKHSNDLGP